MKLLIVLIVMVSAGAGAQGQILKKITDKVKNKPAVVPANKEISTNKNDLDTTATNKTNSTTIKENPATTSTSDPKVMASESVGLKTYSKYDFVPGEKLIAFEDFSNGTIGDFPVGWNSTGSGEIVTIEGKPGRWLWLTQPGLFVPEFIATFPEDFTFEFDLMHGVPINGPKFILCFAELSNLDQPHGWAMSNNQFNIALDNANSGSTLDVSRFVARKNSSSDIQTSSNPGVLNDKNNPIHIAVWRQKERVRVYANETKIWDIPKATVKDAKFNAIIFSVVYAEETVKHYLGNLRLAVGAPDTRNKILTQNKWVTHGILFDVNSATIKPESFGTLKEMANVLKEFADLKIKIVGHTDADGKDADNLDLSKRRAASVRTALVNEFGIDEKRLETDGKGESEPIDKNESPAAKAKNRRVEFIKL